MHSLSLRFALLCLVAALSFTARAGEPQAAQRFDESRMTPPQFLSGPAPKYDDRAIEHGIQGLVSVRCVVTTEGKVNDCHVVRGLPFLDTAVVQALEQRRYTPAMVDGHPVAVDYQFDVRMQLPH